MSNSSELELVGRLVTTGEITRVETEGTVIRAVDDLLNPPDTSVFMASGFIDLQVNGFAGVDYNDQEITSDQIAASVRAMFSTGVTKFFPTIITGSEERILGALRNVTAALREFERNDLSEAYAIAGFHVEGPHISPENGPRGAHPLEHIRAPDIAPIIVPTRPPEMRGSKNTGTRAVGILRGLRRRTARSPAFLPIDAGVGISAAKTHEA